jgi:hypothetical protein
MSKKWKRLGAMHGLCVWFHPEKNLPADVQETIRYYCHRRVEGLSIEKTVVVNEGQEPEPVAAKESVQVDPKGKAEPLAPIVELAKEYAANYKAAMDYDVFRHEKMQPEKFNRPSVKNILSWSAQLDMIDKVANGPKEVIAPTWPDQARYAVTILEGRGEANGLKGSGLKEHYASLHYLRPPVNIEPKIYRVNVYDYNYWAFTTDRSLAVLPFSKGVERLANYFVEWAKKYGLIPPNESVRLYNTPGKKEGTRRWWEGE